MITRSGSSQTEMGRLPEGWEVHSVESLAKEIRNGFASGQRDENGIVQVRMNNVTNGGRLVFDTYLKVPTPDDVGRYVLAEGDFLFNNTNSWELVGKSTVFKSAPFPCVFSNHFTRIRFKQGSILPELVRYFFLSLWRKGVFRSAAIRHVGQSAVQTSFLKNIQIPVPPLAEQRKMVSVLEGLEKAVDQTDEVIGAVRKIKRGLMQELLARGIEHKNFRETEMGEIPNEWKICTLGELTKVVAGNAFKLELQGKNGGIPFFKVSDMNAPENTMWMVHANNYVDQDMVEKQGYGVYPRNTVIFPKVGAALLTNKRRILSSDACFDNNIAGLIPLDIDPLYLLYFMNTIDFKEYTQSSTLESINASIIKKIQIPTPPEAEQKRIAAILNTVDNKTKFELEKRGQLEKLQKGLMQDLLTGRVRFPEFSNGASV